MDKKFFCTISDLRVISGEKVLHHRDGLVGGKAAELDEIQT